jgi:hypothetical protein
MNLIQTKLCLLNLEDVIKKEDFYLTDSDGLNRRLFHSAIESTIGMTVKTVEEEFAMTNGFYRYDYIT